MRRLRAVLRTPCRCVVVLAVLALHGASAQSLSGSGSISGVVHDPSGALVPDALVVVSNDSNGVRRSLRTDSSGVFTIPALPPASGYAVTVSKSGFSSHERVGIHVHVGEDVNLLVALTLRESEAKVTVEEVSAIAQTKIDVSQVIGSSQILNLPINGRRVETYVLMTPAVVPDGTQGLFSFRGIAGGNAFLTDGNDTSNQFFHENAGRTRIFTQISQDAVQEFQVLSSSYSAEYGRASGGIINTVTRSGSNSQYGTAYWFFRNRSLNARDPHSAINPPEWRHQAGGSLGGKIVPDKLFYFVNFEAHRRHFPLVNYLGRPPLFDPSGKFVGTCDTTKATPAQCAAALQFLQRQFQVLDRSADSELAFGRLDWMPSERHAVSASFNYLRFLSPNGYQTQAVLTNGEGVGANGDSSVRTRYARLSWRFVPTGSKINEVRF
ncbi:MAG TPA: carboxypeptidase regulatory-like domain-containing protein, partial [Bryobacteraceae bacterium]